MTAALLALYADIGQLWEQRTVAFSTRLLTEVVLRRLDDARDGADVDDTAGIPMLVLGCLR